MKDLDCDVLNLTDSECTDFENTIGYAQGAAALAVITLVIKALLTWMSWCNTRNRILWLLMVVATGVDVIYGILAFMAVGGYQSSSDNFPNSGSLETGVGWGLFLLSGLVAWVCAGLDLLVLIKGTGDNAEVKETSNDA